MVISPAALLDLRTQLAAARARAEAAEARACTAEAELARKVAQASSTEALIANLKPDLNSPLEK
jgi:transposase